MKRALVLYGLVVAFCLGAVGLVHAADGPREPSWAAAYPVTALLALAVVHLALVRSGLHGDGLLLPLTAALLGVGLAALYRLSPELAARQATAVCAGLVALVAGAVVASRPHGVGRLGAPCGAVFLLLVAAPLLLEAGTGGLPRVEIGPVAFQTLGLALAPFVVFAAGELGRGRGVPLVLVGAAGVLLLVAHRDVGGAAALLATSLGVAYVATGRLKPLALAAAAFAAVTVLALPRLPHLQPRVQGWLDPWGDPAGAGYQTLQATFALASGGLFGAGPGAGHPDLVPAAHTDLLLVVVGEEWGFAGVLAVLALYALWTTRVLRAGITAPDPPSRLLAAGVAVAVGVQAFGVAAGNVRLVPLVGLPLPFLSYGGFWVLGHLALVGLALGVSHRAGGP